MALYDFRCKSCNVIFEDVSVYDDTTEDHVRPVDCPICGEPCGVVWLKAPGMNGDENLTREEKVAAALKLGIGQDGKLTIPQTRSDLKKIRALVGDFRVGERELLTREKRTPRSEEEKRADKAETIEMLRARRAKLRSGEIPRATPDAETVAAMNSTPMTESRILSKNGVSNGR